MMTYDKGVLWHSLESNFLRSAHERALQHALGDYTYKITTTFPKGQWITFPWCCKANVVLNHFETPSGKVISTYREHILHMEVANGLATLRIRAYVTPTSSTVRSRYIAVIFSITYERHPIARSGVQV